MRLNVAASSWLVSSTGSGVFSLEQRSGVDAWSASRLLASTTGADSGTVRTTAVDAADPPRQRPRSIALH